MNPTKKTSVALIVFAWLFVGLPWGWGIAQLWKNAQKLFVAPPPVATAPAATAPATPAPPAAAAPATAPK